MELKGGMMVMDGTVSSSPWLLGALVTLGGGWLDDASIVAMEEEEEDARGAKDVDDVLPLKENDVDGARVALEAEEENKEVAKRQCQMWRHNSICWYII